MTTQGSTSLVEYFIIFFNCIIFRIYTGRFEIVKLCCALNLRNQFCLKDLPHSIYSTDHD